MKPVACGNQTYSTGTFSSAATISAILFSKPSPLSLENGMLAGSAHTRSDKRLTRSIRWPSAARAEATTPMLSRMLSSVARLLPAKASFVMLVRCRRSFGTLERTPARQAAFGARLEINVYVIDVAHHIWIIAECRHNALLGGADRLAAARDDLQEVLIAQGL